MKRVICLYRVSTLGQVDHDDIPMQKTACREYAARHPDWKIVDEISEKGVSGYKISTNERDAILEIKNRAVLHQFDVLLVFMFDRIGRRDDETPFVVQWFVQQGIEVWSAREGEQRFDTHVDKLMNYIRFWQASGESEKTAIRVRTKHSQMVQECQWRGGLVAYGYHLVQKGRTNKKNQPVPDLEIDEDEAKIVREIYHLLLDEGYGTNRVAKYLNAKGIKTKRGTTLWRGTSIRALIDNPIYKGILRFGPERSQPFKHLIIIDEARYDKCLEIVKGRAKGSTKDQDSPQTSASRSLLTGLLYCADCGSKLCFTHNTTRRHLASGDIRLHERDLYRCYRKISAPDSCKGQSAYHVEPIIEAVETKVREFLSQIGEIPEEDLLKLAASRKQEVCEVALKQARSDYENAKRQVDVLEDQAIKALTGESQLDLSVINSMLVKHRAKMAEALDAMEEAEGRMSAEKQNAQNAKAEIDEIRSWVDHYDESSVEAKHMVIARLIDRIEVGKGYEVHIQFRVSVAQLVKKTA